MIAPGNIPNIFSLPLSALEIATSNGVGLENKLFSNLKHPAQFSSSKKQIGFSFSNLFSNELSSSIFDFSRKYKFNFTYQFGLIIISISDIPDTRELFSNENEFFPDYSSIKNFNFNQYFFKINFAKNINIKNKIGINILPHFYQFDSMKGYGVLANISFLKQLNSHVKYSIILNSIPGSFTMWGNNYIEFYPIELRSNISLSFYKININSLLDYNSESINIFGPKFWTKDGFDYSISVNYIVNKNLEFILSSGDMIYLSGGFIFEYKGIEIHYATGKQNFDSISMLHQGIDFIIDLNRINEWKKILKP